MDKLCVVSYYGPIETIKLAEDELSKYFDIYDYPLFKYIKEQINYTDQFIKYIVDNNIKYVLWWFMNIDTPEFIKIKKQTNVEYIYFNWDEPFNWPHCDIPNKMPYLDYAFVTCKETLQTYIDNGCKHAYCLYPGYSPNVNYMIDTLNIDLYNKYSCDISFCCTNLYENKKLFPDQYINRKELIDDIYKNQFIYNYTFYIYGPDYLKELYPESYKGFTKYEQLNYIFNYSKINLCTHVLNNKYGYLNERVILIGGSGGLILVDHVKGIEDEFNNNEQIIILEKNKYIEQISKILDNYDEYINIRKNLNKVCIEKYTYDKWAEFINNKLYNL
jgi:hypothetical protein